MNIRYLSIILFLFLMIGCENMSDLPVAANAFIELTEYEVSMDESTINVVITSDADVRVAEKAGWMTEVEKHVVGNKYIFTFHVASNINTKMRSAEIKFVMGDQTRSVSVTQGAYPVYVPSGSLAGLETIVEKITLEKIDVNGEFLGGNASMSKGGGHVANLFDDNRDGGTYRSTPDKDGGNNGTSYATLLSKIDTEYPLQIDMFIPQKYADYVIDHVAYVHAKDNMGPLGEVDLYVSEREDVRSQWTAADLQAFRKVGSFDFGFDMVGRQVVNMAATRYESGIRTVRLAIKTAKEPKGEDNMGRFQVSAQEIEVYGQLPLDFQADVLFTDNSCSALKEGIDQDMIDDYQYELFRNVANYLYLGLYPAERVIEVEGDRDTAIMTDNMVNLVVMAEGVNASEVKLEIVSNEGDVVKILSLNNEGPNVFKSCPTGSVRVKYSGNTPVKLNFVTGDIMMD